jgi:hypothetical protein
MRSGEWGVRSGDPANPATGLWGYLAPNVGRPPFLVHPQIRDIGGIGVDLGFGCPLSFMLCVNQYFFFQWLRC